MRGHVINRLLVWAVVATSICFSDEGFCRANESGHSAASSVALSSNLESDDIGPRHPLGEVALYEIDLDRRRTSLMFQDGNLTTKVTKYLPKHSQGSSYEVQLEYDITTRPGGRQTGTATFALEAKFFDPVFLENLRTKGYYEAPRYKISYLNAETVQNMDGTVYRDCDKIYLYDIVLDQPSGGPKHHDVGTDFLDDPHLRDLTIVAYLYPQVPVLGAVKLDLAGKLNRVNVRAGLDYLPTGR